MHITHYTLHITLHFVWVNDDFIMLFFCSPFRFELMLMGRRLCYGVGGRVYVCAGEIQFENAWLKERMSVMAGNMSIHYDYLNNFFRSLHGIISYFAPGKSQKSYSLNSLRVRSIQHRHSLNKIPTGIKRNQTKACMRLMQKKI